MAEETEEILAGAILIAKHLYVFLGSQIMSNIEVYIRIEEVEASWWGIWYSAGPRERGTDCGL